MSLGVNMIELLDALLEAPPSPLGPKDKDSIMIIRNRLKPIIDTIPTIDTHDNTTTNSPTVMISYAWETNKHLVEQITKVLKQNGIDVWRDEEGSSKIGKMSGDIMDKMAEVVTKSTIFIVCLSEAYKRRPNCRSEGGLIRRKQNKGKKLISAYYY